SESEAVLRIIRLAFDNADILNVILSGDISARRVDTLHRCYVRAALVESEGEIWVAELERPESPGQRDIVGMALWFLPGTPFLSTERQRRASNISEFCEVVGERQSRWFLDYVSPFHSPFLHVQLPTAPEYLPGLDALWNCCCPNPSESFSTSYQLSKLAILPGYDNHGLASALIRPIIERAAREGNRILGQAASDKVTRIYTHVGCRVLGTVVFMPFPSLKSGLAGGGDRRMVNPLKIWAIELRPEVVLRRTHWKRSITASEPILARL
ncbi:hypothetical protein CALCODRAFT_499058, partial [Calocera cornea HHB12733]